jgi:hypothetical protein
MFLLGLALASSMLAPSAVWPDEWVPARWQGGPLEVERRVRAKSLPPEPAVRETLLRWYEPETLDLLAGTPINCLLVTWSIGADDALERKQQQLIQTYTRLARARGIVVLGLVYSDSGEAVYIKSAATAGLDGLVFERADGAAKTVLRAAKWPVLDVHGLWPRARQPSEMGIPAGPSSQPWIDSNIWLVRSLRAGNPSRPVWITSTPMPGAAIDYPRAVADAAIAGGRWIVSLDDAFRVNLLGKRPAEQEAWKVLTNYLRFYSEHSEWNVFSPSGPLGVIQDAAGDYSEMSGEYLNLVARRNVPYRAIDRAGLTAATLKGLTAVLAVLLAPPSDGERKLLRTFAEGGGLVIAGRAWGGEIAEGENYRETPAASGRIVVYRDELPDPESVAKDVLGLLEGDLNVRLFNVPSVLSYASCDASGSRFLLQMLNYGRHAAESITVRIKGDFRRVRWYTPEAGVADMAVEKTGSWTEVAIPKLTISGALLMEK